MTAGILARMPNLFDMPKVNTFASWIVAAAAALPLLLAFTPVSGDPNEDETAVRGLVKTLEDGWNSGDSAKYASAFEKNADFVVVNGMHVRTRTAIDSGHKQIFDTFYKGSHNKGIVKQIRFIRSDVALMHVEWTLEHGPNRSIKDHALSTIVAVKTGKKWEITAFQNTYIK